MCRKAAHCPPGLMQVTEREHRISRCDTSNRIQTDNKSGPGPKSRPMHVDLPRLPRNHQSNPIISSRGHHTDRLIRAVGGNEAPLAVATLNQMTQTTNPIAHKPTALKSIRLSPLH